MKTADLYSLEGIDAHVGLNYTGDQKTYAGVLRDFHHFISKYSERLTLCTINICLREAANGMRNIIILPFSELQVKNIQKIILVDWF